MIELLLLLAALAPGTATLSGERWQGLQPDAPAVEQPRRPWVSERDVQLTVLKDAVLVHATWQVQPGDATWFLDPIAGPDTRVQAVLWDGEPARAHAVRRGIVAPRRLSAPATLELIASVPRHDHADLHLLAAARGEVRVVGAPRSELLGGTEVEANRFWTGAPSMRLRVLPPRPGQPPPLALGLVAVGLTVDDGLLEGQALLRVEPRRGRVQQLRLRHDLGAALVVTDAAGGAVQQQGDELLVRWSEPRDRALQVRVAWSRALPDDAEVRAPLPTLALLDVARSEAYLQVARSGDRDVLPTVAGRPIPTRALPSWAEGLVGGAQVAAYGPDVRGGELLSLKLQPAPVPETLVDVAEYRAALSRDGRLLVRARYLVRNDRAPALQIRPPAGWTLLAARVDGAAARPLVQGQELRLPIPRSLESVDGLLAFPVELAWLGQQGTWRPRESRTLPLPAVGAAVAVQRATVHLPPEWRGQAPERADGRVDGFSEGADVRFGYGLDEAGEQKAEEAQALFQEATEAWKKNDFRTAEVYLDELDRRGATNADVGRLRGNLDVATGRRAARSTAERRVRQQAQARAAEQEVEYARKKAKAQASRRRGDREEAERAYLDALELAETLSLLQDGEDFDDDVARLQAELGPAATPAAPPGARSPGASSGAGRGARRAPSTTAASPSFEAPPPPDRSLPPWPSVEDGAPRRPRLDPTGAAHAADNLSKFDYGDPAIDRWGALFGLGALGAFGAGSGGSGFGSGSSVDGLLAKPSVVPVVAATRFVPVPRLGEALLFQRLLVPAWEAPTLTLRARRRPGARP